jgi:hypothetical protein
MSNALQATVNSLNAEMDKEAQKMLEQIEKNHLRPLARESYVCAVKCYDKAGSSSSQQQIQQCTQNCQVPFQNGQNSVNHEVQFFQDRLNRSMMACQDEVRDMMTPDIQDNPKQMQKMESMATTCFNKVVKSHIGMLPDMKKRIIDQLQPSK